MRWHGCETNNYDESKLQISNDGINWNDLWINGSTFQDSSWQEENYDISEYAAGQPTVYIRWTMGETDSSVTESGWNIDDVQIYTTQEPSLEEVVPSLNTLGILIILGLFTIIFNKFKK